jgi:hypothetical protein
LVCDFFDAVRSCDADRSILEYLIAFKGICQRLRWREFDKRIILFFNKGFHWLNWVEAINGKRNGTFCKLRPTAFGNINIKKGAKKSFGSLKTLRL